MPALCDPGGGAVPFGPVHAAAEMMALSGDDACRAVIIGALARTAWIDTLLLVPAGAAFLSLTLLSLRDAGRRLALAGIGAVALAALLDLAGTALLAMLFADRSAAAPLALLLPVTHARSIALAVAGFATGALLVRRRGAERIAAVPVLGGTLLAATLVCLNPRHPMLADGFRIAWGTLLLLAGWRTLRPAAGGSG